MSKFQLRAACSVLAIAVVGAGGAAAQVLEEIVVTARKLEENLMEVPLAITAFSARDIEAMNMKQLTDIAMMTPSFNFVNQAGGSGRNDRSNNSLTFRGLYLNNNSGTAAGGQLFIDGAPVIGASAPSAGDVERIEILKGPQSAYFGRSTFMGAINFVMREPGDDFRGRATAEYASYDSMETTLSVEGPIVADKAAIRVSGRYSDRGGHYANAANPSEQLGEQTTRSVSASFVGRPNDNLKISAFVNYFTDSDGTPAQGTIKQDLFNCFIPGLPVNSRASFGYYCGALPKANEVPRSQISADSVLTPFFFDQVWNQTPPHWKIFDPYFIDHYGLEREAYQSDVHIEYDLGGYTLSAATAYHRDKTSVVLDSSYFADGDLPNPRFTPTNGLPRNFVFFRMTQGLVRDISQELRLTSPQDQSFRWTVGGNYLNVRSPGGTVFGYDIGGRAFAGSITRSKQDTPAVFGGLYYDVIENLTLGAEARYQWDKIRQTPYVNAQGNIVTGAASRTLQNTFKSFSPRVTIDYKYAENSTVYALFSRGYRPGGFNSVLATVTDQRVIDALLAQSPGAGLSFLQERLDNYEAGIKATFLDGRARATLSAYYDEWVNGQSGAQVPVRLDATPTLPAVSNLFNITINTGLAKLKGFELESQFQVTDQLQISGSFGLNKSKISTSNFALYNCADCANIQGNSKLGLGNQLPTAPKVMWALSAQFNDHLTGDYDWFSRIDWSHRGRNFTDFTNLAWVGASNNVNARIGVRTETFNLEAFVTNLTQNRVMAAGLTGVEVYSFAVPPTKNSIRYSLPLKRTFGLRAGYNF